MTMTHTTAHKRTYQMTTKGRAAESLKLAGTPLPLGPGD